MKDTNIIPKLFIYICVVGFAFFYFFSTDKALASAQPREISKKIRILIVPGHEPNSGGTEFRGIRERDLAVEIGQNLKKLLEADGHYEVFITRDTVSWTPAFGNYFKNHWDDIVAWKKKSVEDDIHNVSLGLVAKPVSIVYHNSVKKDVAIRLYGITKWANENSIDMMIHIHLNDDTEHGKNKAGDFSGFAIYVPSPQYDNSSESHTIAQDIKSQLEVHDTVSSFKKESAGIIDEPKLIAVGVHNTSKVPSLLIEYGYIYEQKFLKSILRHNTLKTLAEDTFSGVQRYYSTQVAQK